MTWASLPRALILPLTTRACSPTSLAEGGVARTRLSFLLVSCAALLGRGARAASMRRDQRAALFQDRKGFAEIIRPLH
jgi:hypothetical protein